MSKIDVTSPFDGKVVGSVHFNTYEEVEAAIDLAHKVLKLKSLQSFVQAKVENHILTLKLKFKEQLMVLKLLLSK